MKTISKGTLCQRFFHALFVLLIGVFGANTFTSCSSDSSGGEETPSSSSVEGTQSSSSEGTPSSSSVASSSSSGGLPSSSSAQPSSSSVASSSSVTGTQSSSSVVECSEGELSGTFTDERDNKSYNWVRICNQIWMAENLNYSGTSNDVGMCGSKTSNLNVPLVNSGGYCDEPGYGRLYDWATANTICPEGWHIPTNAEWATLINYVENDNGCTNCAGKHLKSASGWTAYSGISNLDSYGFAALPGGSGSDLDNQFYNVGQLGAWWTVTEYNGNPAYPDGTYAYSSRIDYNYDVASRSFTEKSRMFSLRCVKN